MLNRNTQRSLQKQLADILEKRISSGKFQKEDKLPSLRSLAQEFDVSHETVNAAMAILKTRNIVNIIPNRGVYVSSRNIPGVKGTGFIGFVLDLGAHRPQLSEVDPLYGELFGLISQELNQHNYHLAGNYICFEEQKDKDILTSLVNDKIDGLIICNLFNPNLHRFVHDNFSPVVALLPAEYFDEFDQVGMDYYRTYYNVAGYYYRKGIKRIKVFNGPDPHYNSHLMLRGIQDAIYKESGEEISLDKLLLSSGGWNHVDAEKYIYNWLTAENTAELLICCNDNLALGAINAIHKKGLKVGRDIQVVGGRNTTLCTMVRPEITSIDYHYTELVKMAVQQLIKRIEGDNSSPLSLKINGHLIERDSTI